MPVFGIRWNAYSLPGLQLLWHFIFKLIVTTASNGNENLRSVMMDMPVITASWFEGHIVNRDLRRAEHRC